MERLDLWHGHRSGAVTVIARRGASGHAPEHTVAAYDLALEIGADVLELDVRVTADGLDNRVDIQAFCRRGLRRARRVAARAPLSQLYEPFETSVSIRRDLCRVARFANAIGPDCGSIDAAPVGAARRHGLRVQPYTVNEPAEIERLLALGVDGLIIDLPDRAAQALAQRAAPAEAA